MFKVNNEDDVNDVVLVSLLLTLNILRTFSCASNVGFEHVFAGDSIQDSQSELSGIINSSNCE